MLASPRMMISTPDQRTRTGRFRRNSEPSAEAPSPRMVKIVVKPATNSSEARNVTRRAWRSSAPETGSEEM